jgi:hypothetical protein
VNLSSQDTLANAERRGARRMSCQLSIELRASTATYAVDLLNISQTGIFVRPAPRSQQVAVVVATLLKPGVRVRLRLYTQGVLDGLEAVGRVAWQSDYGAGVEFTELTPALDSLIVDLVEGDDRDLTLASITQATLHVTR